MIGSRRRGASVVVAVLALMSGVTPAAAASYTVEPITQNRQSSEPSLAVDASGHRHVAFTVAGADDGIHYATDASGAWSDVLIPGTEADSRPSLALDPSGSPAVAWSAASGGVRYASLAGGWTVETVSAEPGGAEASLAFDSAGAPQIAMRLGVAPPYGFGLGLFYASPDGSGGWTVEQLTPYEYDRDPSLVIDGSDRAHIGYNNGGDQLMYLTNPGGVWSSVYVAGGSVRQLDIALDSSGEPHFAISLPGDGVYFVTPDGDPLLDPWTLDLVSEGYHEQVSLAIDDNDIDHVGFVDGTFTTPVVATKAAGSWQLSTVSPAFVQAISLAADPATDGLVVATDPTEGDAMSGIVVASSGAGDTWASVQVSADALDTVASLAVDAQGGEHVAFARIGTNPGLYYASRAAGSWNVARIAPASNANTVALAMAPDGSAHVVFAYDQDANDAYSLVYGTNRSGSWVFTTVQGPTSQPTGRDVAIGATGTALVPYLAVGRRASVTVAEIGGRRVVTKVVDRSGFFYAPSIAVDAAGVAHLAYLRDNTTIHASNAGGRWKTEVAAPSTAFLGFPSIAVGSDGTVTIAAAGLDDQKLHVLTRAGTTWTNDAIDVPGGTRTNPSLDVDGTVRELATIGIVDDVWRVFRVSDRMGSWIVDEVAASLDGGAPSLAVEAGGAVGIVFPARPGLSIARG